MAEIYTFSARDILEFMNIAGLGMAGEATHFCSRLYVCVNEREGDCRKRNTLQVGMSLNIWGQSLKLMKSVAGSAEKSTGREKEWFKKDIVSDKIKEIAFKTVVRPLMYAV